MNSKIESQENPQAKPILTSFCFSDVHNCFSMLEPPYVLRKSATLAIDTLLATKGQVDVVMMGGDYMSDYPGWLNCSNTLPYAYYLGYTDKKRKFPSTATPKMSQGMYIDVFPDRVVFTMMNFGNYPGYETETPIAPYTVYRND